MVAADHTRFNRYNIFTDNKGAILRLMNLHAAKPGQYLYKELTNVWSLLSSDARLNVFWCPGHSGIRGNEIADKKANEAVGVGGAPPLQLYSNLTKARRAILSDHMTSNRQLRSRAPEIGIQASAILSQLASGCCSLNGYLFQIRKVAEPSCPRCDYHKESVAIFFNHCIAYTTHRRNLKRSLRRQKVPYNPNDLSSVLRNRKAWPELEIFIRKSNRFACLRDEMDDNL